MIACWDGVRRTGDCRLARRAHVFAGWSRRISAWLGIFAAVALCGCGTRGFSIEDAVPDRSLVTHSISRPQPDISADPVTASDEETIRNAVSSAVVDQLGEGGIGWANAATGSRGSIRAVSERQDNNRLCRRFTASRESFDGVHLYRGETCLGPARIWTMTAFDRVE